VRLSGHLSVIGWVVIATALLAAAASAWQVQAWRNGLQLGRQARLHTEVLARMREAAALQDQAQQQRRLVLEHQLSSSEQSHYQFLDDAQREQNRLRDRLATADLRLSILLASPSVNSPALLATAAAGSLVHAGARAQLDPAHAQRIVGITDAGDRGLIALAACQAYARRVSSK
jgi:hypothetical protein